MTRAEPRNPDLTRIFEEYLQDERSARFIARVAERYSVPTLERLSEHGSRLVRRAAVMAVGYLGDYRSNAVLGRRLRDADRGVRMIAERGIRSVWLRQGSEAQQQWLATIARLNRSGQFTRAIEQATRLIDEAPDLAEAWNQRAVAFYQWEQYRRSILDCRQALELNPYHFAAAVGKAHGYLELNDPYAALGCFRRALRLNPDMTAVRAQVDYLQRALKGNS